MESSVVGRLGYSALLRDMGQFNSYGARSMIFDRSASAGVQKETIDTYFRGTTMGVVFTDLRPESLGHNYPVSSGMSTSSNVMS